MSPEDREAIIENAVAYYRRRVWWAEVDDMRQVAAEATLLAERDFDPRVGVPEEAYVYRAASYAIRRVLWRHSAPVTGGRPDDRKGLHRAFMNTVDEHETIQIELGEQSKQGLQGDASALYCQNPNPEDALDIEQHLEGLRARMREVCSQSAGALEGLESLLREDRPSSDGVTPFKKRGEEYKKRNKATRCLRGDRKLWMLLKRRED